MKIRRKIVSIDEERCNGCGQCVLACAEGAIELVGGKARLVSENYCDGLAACLGECPQGAISIVEREADAFDPEAVEHYLQRKGGGERIAGIKEQKTDAPNTSDMQAGAQTLDVLPCGCPSTHIQMFKSSCEAANQPVSHSVAYSALSHWPVQIKLVPPTAPFLKGADLLVASDCAPVACPNFHGDFLKGRTVLLGCPKFDDTEEYIDKLTDIFGTAGIRNITILIMEVPCCSKMPLIVQQAMARAGKSIPAETITVSAKGAIVKKQKLAA
ncbi:MAG TPA: 4Fe-4S binding protein [Syntrophorhabdaceae bacterium]|nr:4Fe-4S binding protein [Syntrophorhabdaceae bacterium]HQM80024.1 4Fe-4S binding protein [Syntrophorhabdaceae bacterium]